MRSMVAVEVVTQISVINRRMIVVKSEREEPKKFIMIIGISKMMRDKFVKI